MRNWLLPTHLTEQEIGARHRANPPRARTGFDFPTALVGATADGAVTVYVDPALGAAGLAGAQELLGGGEADFQWNQGIYTPRGKTANRVNVIIAALGGATDGAPAEAGALFFMPAERPANSGGAVVSGARARSRRVRSLRVDFRLPHGRRMAAKAAETVVGATGIEPVTPPV